METCLCNPDQLSWLVPISLYQGDSPNNPLITLFHPLTTLLHLLTALLHLLTILLHLLTTLLHLLTTLLHHSLLPIPQLAGPLLRVSPHVVVPSIPCMYTSSSDH